MLSCPSCGEALPERFDNLQRRINRAPFATVEEREDQPSCEVCGVGLPMLPGAYVPRRFCSNACRQKGYRIRKRERGTDPL